MSKTTRRVAQNAPSGADKASDLFEQAVGNKPSGDGGAFGLFGRSVGLSIEKDEDEVTVKTNSDKASDLFDSIVAPTITEADSAAIPSIPIPSNGKPNDYPDSPQSSSSEESALSMEVNREDSQGSITAKVDSSLNIQTPPRPQKTTDIMPPPPVPVRSFSSPGKRKIEETTTQPTAQVEQEQKKAPQEKKIFQMRKTTSNRAVYKHAWHNDDSEQGEAQASTAASTIVKQSTGGGDVYDFEPTSPPSAEPPKMRRVEAQSTELTRSTRCRGGEMLGDSMEEITRVRCHKESKELFSVVRNVRQAHQCRERGEMQEHSDQINYLLSSMVPKLNKSMRVLSLASLVEHALDPQFRQLIRIRSYLPKILKCIGDILDDSVVALYTSVLLYFFARDRSGIVVDRKMLDVVSQLLRHTDADSGRGFDAAQAKVASWLEKWRQDGSAKLELTQTDLCSSELILEALLYFATRNRDDGFKRNICAAGILDYLCSELIALSKLSQTERLVRQRRLILVLRLLEMATLESKSNQHHLITYADYAVLHACVTIFDDSTAASTVTEQSSTTTSSSRRRSPRKTNSPSPGEGTTSTSTTSVDATVAGDCASAVIRVLCNLSHGNELCAVKLSSNMNFVRRCVAWVISAGTADKQHSDADLDLLLLTLGLLINMVEHTEANRSAVVSSHDSSVLDGLVQLFIKHNDAAAVHEEALDPEKQHPPGASEESSAEEPTEREMQNIINAALQKAEAHMQDSVFAAYTALLISLLLQDNDANVKTVKAALPGGDLRPMITQLQIFAEFIEKMGERFHRGDQLKAIKKAIDRFEQLVET